MATVTDINVKGYCDTVYTRLTDIKKSIEDMRDNLEHTYGVESELFEVHDRHLCELADFVDWKLQILMKVCPFEWKGRDEGIESSVSVSPPENLRDTDVSGGYMGG